MKREKVNFSPCKEFFIMSLTKDIELNSAIFDLIDNSINAAREKNGYKLFKESYVKISIGKSENNEFDFTIIDNCGGITIEDAENKAFRLGNNFKNYTKGYGIGMKRAIFKIAESFEIHSKTNNDNQFSIKMDVSQWVNTEKWDLKFNNNEKLVCNGMGVYVSKLNEEIKEELLSKKFIKNFIKLLKVKYKFILEAGFKMYVNGEELVCKAVNEEKNLFCKTYIIEGNDVNITIENKYINEFENYGWSYVVNGIIIVSGDKGELSNWEEMINDSRYNYDKFIGYVKILGDNVANIPINTTKDGIDKNSDIYKKILNCMKSAILETKEEFFSNEASIQYKKPVGEINKLKAFLDEDYNSEVGRKSFEHMLGEITKK